MCLVEMHGNIQHLQNVDYSTLFDGRCVITAR